VASPFLIQTGRATTNLRWSKDGSTAFPLNKPFAVAKPPD
jgi:hypothetical protein